MMSLDRSNRAPGVYGVQRGWLIILAFLTHSKNILRESSNTNLGFLSDRILISVPRSKIYSVGDLLLMAGVAIFVVEASLKAWGSRGGAPLIRSKAAPNRGA